jgi:hypothetical protein
MMKKLRLLLLTVFALGTTVSYSQTPVTLKPTVTEKFDKLYMSENFDSATSQWSTISNAENLLLVQDGEYILQRKAPTSPFATMGNFNNGLTAYRLVTSLKLEKSANEDGSVGLIFMAQQGGQGGYIFEFNKKMEYRLRQIAGSTYKYLTGSAKDGGWLKGPNLKGISLPNLIEVRFADKNYDLYINNVLAISFNEISYKSGDIGYLIGPGSKAKVDFMYLFTNQKVKDELNAGNGTSHSSMTGNTPENDVMALAESIISLKTQINKLTEDNEDLKQQVDNLKSADKDNETQRAQFQKSIKAQDAQLKKAQFSFDSLLKVNADLQKYKEMVSGNDGGDLVISLSKNLKNEKLKNDALQKSNQQLRDSIAELKVKMPKGTNANSQKDSSKTGTEKKEFVLPKEN